VGATSSAASSAEQWKRRQVEQAPVELGVGARQPDRRHLQDHLVRRERLGAEERAELAPRLAGKRHAAGADGIPVVLAVRVALRWA